MLQYRSDVDGLRAVAVLAVVLYHLKIEFLSGGFVGVDIFFVISGFLITSIIRHDVECDRFSYIEFYQRRFRRILPAMFVMVIAVLILSAVLFDPAQYQSVGESAASTLLFGANIYFEHAVGYFDSQAESKPLLHMWSLGVEEQFYIFLPVLMLFLNRKYSPVKTTKVLLVILMISFAAAALNVEKKPTEAFYLLHFRAWELLLGSLLAYVGAFKGSDAKAGLISLFGVFLIGFAILGFDHDTVFPGPSAMFPVLGTALIIWAGRAGNPISQLLSHKVLVWIGLISYSLYLWHWPVIVFSEYFYLAGYRVNSPVVMFVCSLLLAYVSWRFVETPLRKKSSALSSEMVVGTGVVASLVLVAAAFVIVLNEGFLQRQYGSDLATVKNDRETWEYWHRCERASKSMSDLESLCGLGEGNGRRAVAVWGDSHAISMAPAVDKALSTVGAKGVFLARNGCPPLLNVSRENKPACYDFNQQVIEFITGNRELSSVVLISRWSAFATGRLAEGSKQVITLVDLEDSSGIQSNPQIFERGFARTIQRLLESGKMVTVVTQVPENSHDVPKISYLLKHFENMDGVKYRTAINEYESRQREVVNVFSAYQSEARVDFFQPAEFLCASGRCDIVRDDIPLYIDDNHLSVHGARQLENPLTHFLAKSSAIYSDSSVASGDVVEVK